MNARAALITVGIFAVAFVATAAVGLFVEWVRRHVAAGAQSRSGPGLLGPVHELVKLTAKETLVPQTARRAAFMLALPWLPTGRRC